MFIPRFCGTSIINQNQKPKQVQASIFYINDVHGQVPNMEKIKTASDTFERTKSDKVDNFKLCAGDVNIGSNQGINMVADVFMNSINLDAMTPGNHEFDDGQNGLNNLDKSANFKILTTNLDIPNTNPLSHSSKMTKSQVILKNGDKYGLIGIQPVDLNKRMKKGTDIGGMTVADKEKTKQEIKSEVENFKKQGINKVILVSHSGYDFEQEVAKSISGIDIIIGGHSHDLLKDFKTQNLFYSPAKEPVIITQAGRDGDNYGVLDVVFDDKGVIKQCSNHVFDTDTQEKSLVMDTLANDIQGKPEELGVINYAEKPQQNRLITENPDADLICDAMKNAAGTDIALMNSGSTRGKLSNASISSRDIESLLPFKDNLYKVKLSEKDLIDALRFSAKCMTTSMNKPGILQTSGLKYSITKDGRLTEASILGKDGKYKALDLNNPSPNKTYTACCNGYLVTTGEGYDTLGKKENIIEKTNLTNIGVTEDYIKSYNGKPFDIKTDGRITTCN